jgi:hypothetical protein
MYLVSSDHVRTGISKEKSPSTPIKRPARPRKTDNFFKKKKRTRRILNKRCKQHLHDKWEGLRTKLSETDVSEEDLLRKIVDYLRKVFPTQRLKRKGNDSPKTQNRSN